MLNKRKRKRHISNISIQCSWSPIQCQKNFGAKSLERDKDHYYSPGHSPRLHLVASVLGPKSLSLHVSPPYSGSGLMHVRVRFLTPGPHVAEQEPQLDQAE